jgi:DNA-directed RNA polymerase
MTTAFEFDMEAKWEQRAARMGVERYRRAAEAADPSTLPAGQRLIRETVGPLKEAFEANKHHVEQSTGRQAVKSEALRWLAEGDSLIQAAASVVSVVQFLFGAPSKTFAYHEGCPAETVSKVSRAISTHLIMCRENAMWVEEDTEESAKLRKEFKLRYPNPTADDWREFRSDHGLARLEVSIPIRLQMGCAPLAWLCETSPRWFQAETAYQQGKTIGLIRLTSEATEILSDITSRAEVAHPMLSPMIVPPNDWRYDEKGNLEGGYSVLRVDALRGMKGEHTRALRRPLSEQSIAALNAVQKTPWALNRWLHDVAEEAQAAGSIIGDREEVVRIPKRLPEGDWKGMRKEAQSAYAKSRREAFEHNASAQGQADALLNTLVAARQVREEAVLYYPHSLDFRGRIYPVPTWGPHPQGNDLARSLLMFSEGRSLGDDGLYWLYIRAANCAGQDKLPLVDRVQWCLDNLDNLKASALAPLEFTWWTEMDEPWGFLATCREIVMALDMDDPSDFLSHLPIPLDGSCNGLQHLSAMALDPTGAAATNLRAGLPRQDIYEDVASEVRDIVDRDIRADVEEALLWQGKVTRKVVKRAVMTTPYGVTKGGIRTQLINDGHAPGDGASRGRAADYLKDCLVEALDRKAGAARGIMAWLQAIAFQLAQAELPFVWTTPSGNRVAQSYRKETVQRVHTLFGHLQIIGEDSASGLNPKKQSLGAAPNYVHSFDAAHLTNTVLACQAEGITDFAMIHDSYGTHACHTTALARLLRDEFVAIYREDWLRKLYEELRAAHPHVDIPEPPGRGEFDLSEVQRSDFFFS